MTEGGVRLDHQNGRLGSACAWFGVVYLGSGGGEGRPCGSVDQYSKVKLAAGRAQTQTGTGTGGTAEARTGRLGVCDGVQEEEDLRGGWERARHPWEMPRPVACLVFIRAQEGTSTPRAARSRVGTGHPRPGNGKPGKPSAAGVPFPFLHSRYIVPQVGIWAGWASCFETAAGLLSERKSLPSPYPAPTIPPAQPSPPITMLLLLTIQHPAGSPAAPRCTKDAREAPARAHCCAALCCSGLRICNRAAQASRLCSREAQLTSIKSDAPQDRLVAAAAAAGRITGTGTRHVH